MKNQNLMALIDDGSQLLILKGVRESEARIEAERLLRSKLGLSQSELILKSPSRIEASVERDFLSLLEKRASGVPLQYLEGAVDFMDFSFRVRPGVLIPRPETENLIERILICLPRFEGKILDIGTGSGCILLSLLKYFPASSGLGIDISRKALEVACENARTLNLENRIEFQMSDVFEKLGSQRFDLIVSNPPYIASGEWNNLALEVKQEPCEALIAGPTGLEYFEKIISRAKDFLTPRGAIFFEVGWNQADEVRQMLEISGFGVVEVFKDDFGVERIVMGSYG